MLGSFDNSQRNPALNYLGVPAKQAINDRNLNDLTRREWAELPYAMMRLTASKMSWDYKRIYWRDQTVQLGEIQLTLAKKRVRGYVAIYSREDLHRDFALSPWLEDDQLRWSATGICDIPQLSTPQLAETLISKLVTFYTQGLR